MHFLKDLEYLTMAIDKHFHSATVEKRISEKWIGQKAFQSGINAKDGQPSYTIMIPPPNVTGVLHMGHAFNNTLQDILIRWKRMQGYNTLWQPGTDHAGIATQMVVERQLAEEGKKRTDFTRDEFLEKIWAWKKKSGGTIISQLQRLGASCDWDREAFTMSGAPNAPKDEDGNFHDAVIKVFVDLYNKGLIYRGKRLVNWDPHFETAISDLEVENIEVAGHMWHFKYLLKGGETYTYIEKDADGNITLTEDRNYISIATTRPETMLGDGAVAVHPSDERYRPLVGKLCEIPVGPKNNRRLIPIITDEYPDPNFGSGAVKITGAHDFNDYQVAKRGNIPMYSLMDKRGVMRCDGLSYKDASAKAELIREEKITWDENLIAAMNLVPEEYRGLDRFKAREKIISEITAEGLAVMTEVTDTDGNSSIQPFVESKAIMQPFGDRSKVVIEPMLTDQWFVETSKIVQPALEAVKNKNIKIIPESGEKTYYYWLNNRENSLVHINEKLIDVSESEPYIEKAVKLFNNDSFWLVAPFKLEDEGTILRTTLIDNKKALMVTYTKGGTTPGDTYVWLFDEKGNPKSFKMWVDLIPIGGLEASWNDWVMTDSKIKLPTAHKIGQLELEIDQIITKVSY